MSTSVVYGKVNHRIFEITQDVRFTELIQNISDRHFFGGPRRQTQQMAQTEEWPPTRQRPCPSVCSTYNDQPVHPTTRSFLYADYLCIATQKQSFDEVDTTLGDALADLSPYYAANHLRANPEKTKISNFHLKNRDAQRELKVVWHRKLLACSHIKASLSRSYSRPIPHVQRPHCEDQCKNRSQE